MKSKTKEFNIQAELENYRSSYCQSCKKRFVTNAFYREHIRRMHLLRIKRNTCQINPDIKPDPSDPNNYCRSCDYTYKSVVTFRTHLKNRHHMQWSRSDSEKNNSQDLCFNSDNKTSPDTTVQDTTVEQEVLDTAIGQHRSDSDESDKDLKQDSIAHHDLSDTRDDNIPSHDTTDDTCQIFTHTYAIYDYLPRIGRIHAYCHGCQTTLFNKKEFKAHIRHYHRMNTKKLLFLLRKKRMFNKMTQKFGCLFCEHTFDSCYRHLEHTAIYHKIKFS